MFRKFKKPQAQTKETFKGERKDFTQEIVAKQESAKTDLDFTNLAPRDQQQWTRGPKTLFHENLDYNLAILAKRFSDDDLRLAQLDTASKTHNRVVVAYLRNLANTGIVNEVKEKIANIKTEIFLDISYLERNIENSNISPFPQTENTTKVDIAVSALLQGRIVILVDGSCDVLLAPTTFFDLMDTPDDAYGRWFIASNFFRIARYIMFLLAVGLPGFYIALLSFHPEMLPTKLAFIIAASAEGTAFPVYFEAFFMMGVVEAVRMILIRLPTQIGAAIAIFAGITLVIAGLYANIFGAPIVIIVTFTIITSFAIPTFDLRLAMRLIQFFAMIMSTLFGLFGFAIAFFYIAIHLATLKSFGIPYMAPLAPTEGSGLGHLIFRKNTVEMPQDETYQPHSTRPQERSEPSGEED